MEIGDSSLDTETNGIVKWKISSINAPRTQRKYNKQGQPIRHSKHIKGASRGKTSTVP